MTAGTGGRATRSALYEGCPLRYLAAFGPASVKDVQMWSGLTRLREVVDRLRPRLEVFRDAVTGADLFDVPDAPHPGADSPAPARFLPEYDNLFIAHTDRTRVLPEEYRRRLWTGNTALPVFLSDGCFIRGAWHLVADRKRTRATLVNRPFEPLPRAERTAWGGGRCAARLPHARRRPRGGLGTVN